MNSEDTEINKLEEYNICRGAYNGCRGSKNEGLFYKYCIDNNEDCLVRQIFQFIQIKQTEFK